MAHKFLDKHACNSFLMWYELCEYFLKVKN